ncbi:MAG: hypothetical protein EOP24_34320 [Hyphomicrobiales bacterium]|nr:MAG: hypothetical protein EOP24_34320 [Hyphomicrobiales bacterium]
MSKSSVTVDAKIFHAAVVRAAAGIGRDKTYPILNCVRLTVANGEMEIVATDLNQRMRLVIPAQGACETLCIEMARLSSVLAAVRERGEVKLTVEGQHAAGSNVKLTCGRSSFSLVSLSAEGYPNLAEPEPGTEFTVRGADLASLIASVSYAIFDGKDRYALHGICLQAGTATEPNVAGQLLAVATDGLAMAVRNIPAPGLPATMASIIVPAAAAAAIGKLFGDAAEVSVRCDDKRLALRADNFDFLTRLIEAEYPPWRNFYPETHAGHAYDAVELRSAISVATAAAEVAKDSGKPMKIIFGETETTLTAVDINAQGFSGHDVIRHQALEPSGFTEIGVNGLRLLEALDHLDVETVEIAVTAGTKLITLRGAGRNDRRCGVMPMLV